MTVQRRFEMRVDGYGNLYTTTGHIPSGSSKVDVIRVKVESTGRGIWNDMSSIEAVFYRADTPESCVIVAGAIVKDEDKDEMYMDFMLPANVSEESGIVYMALIGHNKTAEENPRDAIFTSSASMISISRGASIRAALGADGVETLLEQARKFKGVSGVEIYTASSNDPINPPDEDFFF